MCKSIKALALPWQGQVDHPDRLTVDDMQVKVRVPLLGGICGPGPVTLAWGNKDGSATFDAVTLGPDCAMDGTMITSPRWISVVPNNPPSPQKRSANPVLLSTPVDPACV